MRWLLLLPLLLQLSLSGQVKSVTTPVTERTTIAVNNAFEWNESATGTPTTQVQNLLIASVEPGVIRLTWDLLGDSNVTSYQVFRATSTGPVVPDDLIGSTGPTENIFSDVDVVGSTTYYYVVRGTTFDDGVGPVSNEVSETAIAPLAEPTVTVTLADVDGFWAAYDVDEAALDWWTNDNWEEQVSGAPAHDSDLAFTEGWQPYFATGKNTADMVDNGGFDTDTIWTKPIGGTISGGKYNYNDPGLRGVYQVVEGGGEIDEYRKGDWYMVQYDVDSVAGGGGFDVQTGGLNTNGTGVGTAHIGAWERLT
jgi:hypothetical protein